MRTKTPDREIISLTNASIPAAFELVEKHGCRTPFCLAITTSGKRTKFVPEQIGQTDADALLRIVHQHIADGVREKRYRAVALVRIVKYWPEVSGRNSDCPEAVQATVDHEQGSPSICYMPFRMVRGMIIQGQPSFEPSKERFFTYAA
jgi:hypothetical protein